MTGSDDTPHRSYAFDGWRQTGSDIRSYLELSEKWVTSAYAEAFESAEREVSERFDLDNDDPEEYFYDAMNRTRGLFEEDFLWMLRAGVLRDAVTAFEVYAEKSAEEVLGRWSFSVDDAPTRRLALFVDNRHTSPSWRNLCRIHEAFGNELEPDSVRYIRNLRHLLAHQRGELRTEELRRHFSAETGPRRGGPFDCRDVPLAHDRVLQMIEDLGSVVRTCDAAIWTHTRGGQPPEALAVLAQERRGPLMFVEG